MTPLSDERVSKLDVSGEPQRQDDNRQAPAPEPLVLSRADYDSVAPTDDIEESMETFEVDAQMQTIDFADPTKWRVRAADERKGADYLDCCKGRMSQEDGR